MNWEPKEMDKHVIDLQNSCHEKDTIITDLRQQLEDQVSVCVAGGGSLS